MLGICCAQPRFVTPRSLMSMRLYNGFRLMCDKCDDPEELKSFLESKPAEQIRDRGAFQGPGRLATVTTTTERLLTRS